MTLEDPISQKYHLIMHNDHASLCIIQYALWDNFSLPHSGTIQNVMHYEIVYCTFSLGLWNSRTNSTMFSLGLWNGRANYAYILQPTMISNQAALVPHQPAGNRLHWFYSLLARLGLQFYITNDWTMWAKNSCDSNSNLRKYWYSNRLLAFFSTPFS
jgi:hypothetical protein